MTEEQIKKIFLPFEQVGDASRRGEGTGLGLAISYRLAQLMDSELKVKSHPDEGTKFWFDVTLPVVSAKETVQEEKRQPQIVGYIGKYRKLLVIDHSGPNRKALTNLLEPANFEIIEALTGEEGVQKLQTKRPDIALINLKLFLALSENIKQEVQQLVKANNIPLVVTSVDDSDLDEHKELISTCQAFLPKECRLINFFKPSKLCWTLTWIYDEPRSEEAETIPYDVDQLKKIITPPPAEEMEVLFDLAMTGDMASLEKRAEQLMAMDKKFVPFATKLSKLARSFEEEKALALVEQYMEKQE